MLFFGFGLAIFLPKSLAVLFVADLFHPVHVSEGHDWPDSPDFDVAKVEVISIAKDDDLVEVPEQIFGKIRVAKR
jgi:hypothetical protein